MKGRLLTGSEALFLLLCAAILIWQLFLPGFIGMANNADFGKVAGPLCMEGADHGADNFLYFQAQYLRGPSHCYRPGVPTSELALAWLASLAQQIAGNRMNFDIRWLGALHAILFAGFYLALLHMLRPLRRSVRYALSAVALWIFADVSTVAQFNSFYTDVAAILGGLAATVLAVHLIQAGRIESSLLVLFALAALLFVTSKAQHGLYGLVPAALVLFLAKRGQRVLCGCIAAVFVASMIWIVAATPGWYRAQARFNLIFFKIARTSATPLQDLRELGLDHSDLRYVGMHSFLPASPMNDPAFVNDFVRRSSYGRVLIFYLHHPARTLSILWSDLRDETWQRRPVNLSNFQRSYGQPAGARTGRFGSWSALRTRLFRWWPAHILLWYALVLILSGWLATRDKLRRPLASTLFIVALLAISEFCFASLADACETYRHLLMFHVFTDVTIFLALLLPWRAART